MALASHSRARLQTSTAVVITLLLWWRAPGVGSAAAAAAALVLALLAWLLPDRFRPVQHAVDRGIQGLLSTLTWLLLGVIYFGLFTPVGWLQRRLGRDPLELRPDKNTASCFQPAPPAATGRFDRQF